MKKTLAKFMAAFLGILAFSVAVIGIAYAVTKTAEQNPVSVVETFYESWKSNHELPFAGQLEASQGLLTAEFSNGLKSAAESLDFDPVFCSASMPSSFRLMFEGYEGDYSLVRVTENFGNDLNDIKVELKQREGSWQISDINCLGTIGGW